MEANQWWQFSATTSHKHCKVAFAEMNVWNKQSSVSEEKVSRVWWAFLHSPNNETRSMHHIAEHLEMNGYKVEITKIVNGLIILNMCHLLWHNYEKTFLARGTIPKSVAIQRKNLFCHFSVQSWNTHRHHKTIMHTWKSHKVRSSTCSSNFMQHMPGQNLCSDTGYSPDFTWYSSVPPAKCQGSPIN
jgi:hypothetical protein